MRMLVLGGTVYLSREVARVALARGHEVTCVARGVSGPPPHGVSFVRGERSDVTVFDGLGSFDAVVDVSRKPSEVRSAVTALGPRAGHWVFVSSSSVYADDATPDQTTAAPLLPAAPPDVDEDAMETYGARKVACEQLLPAGAFICRAGLIIGPDDPNDRFGYWVLRLDRGGAVLAPGSPGRLVQVIDVRDLAAWLVDAAEQRLSGVFDGMGAPLPFGDFLRAIDSAADLIWVDQQFLLDRDVAPWMGSRSLPLWLPEPEYAGFGSRDVSASLAAGLHTRPISESARRRLAWERTLPAPHRLAAGITADEEAELLAGWSAHSR